MEKQLQKVVTEMEKLVLAMGMRWDPARFEHTTKSLASFTLAKALTDSGHPTGGATCVVHRMGQLGW